MRKHLVNEQVLLGCEAEVSSRKLEGCLVENTYNELLAEDGRQSRNTEVVFLIAYGHIYTSVLRNAALRDIQTRHDLKTGADSGIRLYGELRALLKITVDTVSYSYLRLEGLYMYIAGAVRNSFFDDRIDKSYRGVIDNVALARYRGALADGGELLIGLLGVEVRESTLGRFYGADRVDISVYLRSSCRTLQFEIGGRCKNIQSRRSPAINGNVTIV